MDSSQRKYALILLLSTVVLAGSLYSYWQQTAQPAQQAVVRPPETPAKSYSDEPVVYVSGWVVKPGVMRVPIDSRVIDVVNTAGGLAVGADVNKVNLAQKVKDGMHIHIPGNYAPSTASQLSPTGNTGKSPLNLSEKININVADKSALDSLPGVGPALAQRIIDYRQTNGQFSDIAELKKVPGIGESKFNQLKDKITI